MIWNTVWKWWFEWHVCFCQQMRSQGMSPDLGQTSGFSQQLSFVPDRRELFKNKQNTNQQYGVLNIPHLHSSPPANNARRVPVKYICSACGYSTNNKTRFTEHERVHTQEKPFQCHHCSYRSSVKSNLTKHVLSQHQNWLSYTRCDKKTWVTSLEGWTYLEAIQCAENISHEAWC